MSVTVIGDKEIVKALNKLGDEVSQALETIGMAAAEVVEAEATRRVNSNRLKKGMVSETLEKSAEAVEIGVGPNKKGWFARFLEFGTGAHTTKPKQAKALKIWQGPFVDEVRVSGAPAQPFLRPALDAKRDEAIEAAESALMAVLPK